MHAQRFSAASKSGRAKSKQSATREMTVTAEGPRPDLKKQGVLCVHVLVGAVEVPTQGCLCIVSYLCVALLECSACNMSFHVHVKCLCVHCKSIGMYSVCTLSGVHLHKVLHMYM